MGCIVRARCRCGYRVRWLHIDCGSSGPAVRFPCLCAACRKVAVVDLLVAAACPECGGETVPVDATQEADAVGNEFFSSFLEDGRGKRHTLNDGAYPCPRCGENRLHFKEEPGLWD